jgi:hypothetical protein
MHVQRIVDLDHMLSVHGVDLRKVSTNDPFRMIDNLITTVDGQVMSLLTVADLTILQGDFAREYRIRVVLQHRIKLRKCDWSNVIIIVYVCHESVHSLRIAKRSTSPDVSRLTIKVINGNIERRAAYGSFDGRSALSLPFSIGIVKQDMNIKHGWSRAGCA